MKKLTGKEYFMMLSNIFLILPVFFAALYHEWLYCFFASGLFIFSPLFHWYKITNPSSVQYRVFRKVDWAFAIAAFLYMYYYVYQYIDGANAVVLYMLLSITIVFFWYGWRRGDYEKWHPWFHIVAPLVSSAILIAAH